jgi:MFS transporter, ACS family, tartrate transporter
MTAPTTLDAATYKIIARRVLPLIFIGQVLLQIDRTNLSFASLGMNQDLRIGAQVFGLAAGIFFIGYALFEVPSNLIMQRVGANRWLGAAIVTWGAMSILMAFVPNAAAFIALRFLLGIAESAYLPGVLLFLGYWLPSGQRGPAVALVVAAGPISSILGGPLAGVLMQVTSFGLSGWQWLFLFEGAAPVIFGAIWFRLLPSEPSKAAWLPPAEKQSLLETLAADRALTSDSPHRASDFLHSLRRPAVWVYSLAYFGLSVGYYGVLFWLPQMIKGGFHVATWQNGLLSAIPFVCAVASLAVFSRTSDRSGDRRFHLLLFGVVGCIALIGSATLPSPVLGFVAICVAMVCAVCFISVFWASPMSLLAGTAAAGSIAMINSLGNLGGFLGPYLAGALRESSGSFAIPTITLSVFLLFAGAIPLVARNLFPNLRKTNRPVSSLSTVNTAAQVRE